MRLDRFEIGMILVVSPFVVLLVWLLLMLPFLLNVEAKCLERGYPKSSVTWNFKTYCMTLDGAVTVRVDRLGAAPAGAGGGE